MADNEAFKAIRDTVSSALAAVTRTTRQLTDEDLPFHRSANPRLATLLDSHSSKILSVAQALTKVSAAGTTVTAPRLQDVDSVEDSWQDIGDLIDHLLENADACIDEYQGAIKRLSPSREAQIRVDPPARKTFAMAKAWNGVDIPKPQLLFAKRPVDDESPFKPLLRSKPHAIFPLEESISPDVGESGSKQYKHPYHAEITQSHYPSDVHVKAEPIASKALEFTQATFVDTYEGVEEMLKELKLATEIAVDLEHHDEHSYIGLVSLMQISTREKDWIVDTLKPWREDLQILNEVFADPKILKVFHGAFMDMIWLQRDLGLYVVGLFDTFHAADCLGYPVKSLAALLKRFVDFDADKKNQRADWRIRPLPKEMFDYARSDTHFLLYIYDNMRNELIEKSEPTIPNGSLIVEVCEKSKAVSLERYEHPIYDQKYGQGFNGWYNMLFRQPSQFNKEQFAVFRAVHQWRDQRARTEDESTNHILHRNVLFKIATEMPMDRAALSRCLKTVDQSARAHMDQLVEVIRKAKLAGATGPRFMDIIPPAKPDTEAPKRISPLAALHSKNDIVATYNTTPSTPLTPTPQSNIFFRTSKSRFWGLTLEHSTPLVHQYLDKIKQLREDIRLAIPLPPLTAEVFENKNSVESSNQHSDAGAMAEVQYIKERKPKEEQTTVFVVKEVGGSRKRKAQDDVREASAAEAEAETQQTNLVESETNEPIPEVEKDYTDDNDDDEKREQEESESYTQEIPPPKNNASSESQNAISQQRRQQVRKESRKRKKARKLEKLERVRNELMKNATMRPQQAQNQEVPYNYETAPSLLHPPPPPPTKKPKGGGESSKKRPFDPYAKSFNAPEGKRRRKEQAGGRSMTFAQ